VFSAGCAVSQAFFFSCLRVLLAGGSTNGGTGGGGGGGDDARRTTSAAPRRRLADGTTAKTLVEAGAGRAGKSKRSTGRERLSRLLAAAFGLGRSLSPCRHREDGGRKFFLVAGSIGVTVGAGVIRAKPSSWPLLEYRPGRALWKTLGTSTVAL
jgi:hypothetical protein